MNTIKNSFSKIKASDEFKDKLLKELQAASLQQKPYIDHNINKSKVLNASNYKEEHLKHKKTYQKQYIAAAAIFCVIIGIVGYKSALIGIQKENDNSEIIAYEPQTEPVTGNDSLAINSNEDNNTSQESKAESSNKYINDRSKNTADDSEKAENFSSYVSSQTISNNSDENKISSNTNKDNISNTTNIGNKQATAPNKPVTKNDSTLKQEESLNKNILPEDNNSSSNLKLVANKPEALEDKPTLAKSTSENANSVETASVNSIYIPKYELPETATYAARRMIPLIIYKGNIYLHSNITIDSKDVNNLLGQKLGTTKNTLTEENIQKEPSTELASNIGVTDVYSVSGYEVDFRIMTNYKSEDGSNTADLYECINGITISKGSDILSKLNLKGNVAMAKFQSYSDWNNGTDNYHPIDNLNLLNSLLDEIDKGTPYLAENIEDSLGDYRNDSEYKELSLDLKDGTKNITLTILKSGYVSYGYPKIYFKINSNFTEELWQKLNL
jgi:hypothetical protein